MNRNHTTKILMTALLAIAIGAGYWIIKETRTMAYADKQPDVKEMMPPIDQQAPEHFETATFALG